MADTADFGTTFHYKVVEGQCKDEHYGERVMREAVLTSQVWSSPSWCLSLVT